MLVPFAIPFQPSEWGVMAYNAVEAVKPGSYVLATTQVGVDDVTKMAAKRVLTNELLRKGCKIVEASFDTVCPIAVEYVWNTLVDKNLLSKVTYGVDYVILPYVPGEVVAWAAVARNIRAACGGVDNRGNRLDDLPLMKGINSASDFQFLTMTGHHTTLAVTPVVTQIQTPYNLPLVVISSGISHALDASFVATGQIKGCLEGLLDFATFEKLTGDLGLNIKQMDVVSFTNILTPTLVIVGNILYFLSKREKKVLSKSEVKK